MHIEIRVRHIGYLDEIGWRAKGVHGMRLAHNTTSYATAGSQLDGKVQEQEVQHCEKEILGALDGKK